jgi:hypothetical protein
MLPTNLALAVSLMAAPAPEPQPVQTGKPAVVTGFQAGKVMRFVGGLATQVEGMALAILGSCSADVSLQVGKERWTKAADEDHIRVVYPDPRPLSGMNDEVLQVTEILLPISAEGGPDFVLVREGEKYRAFSKFSFQSTKVLKDYLDSLRRTR